MFMEENKMVYLKKWGFQTQKQEQTLGLNVFLANNYQVTSTSHTI